MGWALTRRTNAYLVKRNGLQLSSEPNNVANKHSFKFSGLANFEAVGVEETDGKRGITLSKGIKKNKQNPKGLLSPRTTRRACVTSPSRSRRRPRVSSTARTLPSLPSRAGTSSGRPRTALSRTRNRSVLRVESGG